MNWINTIFLLSFLFSSTILADELSVSDSELAHAVEARISLLEVEVQQLEQAIQVLRQDLTQEELFEKIAQTAFSATDNSVSSYGFSLKTLYAFEARYQAALQQWFENHPGYQNTITELEQVILDRQQDFDQAIAPYTAN